MYWKIIAFSVSVCTLTGCMAFEDYDYDGYAVESPLCSKNDCSWSMRFGDDQDQAPRAVALNEVGDVFLAGMYTGRFEFKADNIASPQAFIKSPFVAEFDPIGKARCLHTLDPGMGGEALAVIPAGKKVIWGGTTSIEGTVGTAFVRIDDSCGSSTPIFTNLSGTGTGSVNGLVLSDDLASVYVAGTVGGLGSIKCVENAPMFDTLDPHLFWARVDVKTGACLHARVYGGGIHSPESIRLLKGGPGQLILAGTYTGTIDGTSLPMESVGAAFVMTVDATTGDVSNANVFRALNNSGAEFAHTKAIAYTGRHLVIAGENNSQSLVDHNDQPIFGAPSEGIDSFLIALDPSSLEKKWAYLLHGENGQSVTGMTSTDSDHLFLTGMFDSSLIFQGKESAPLTCDLPRCAFFAKLKGASTAPEEDTLTPVGADEMIPEAAAIMAANKAGLVWAASSSVEVTIDPEVPLPPTQMLLDLDVVLAKFYPVP